MRAARPMKAPVNDRGHAARRRPVSKPRAPRPLRGEIRFGPNLYVAQTHPGLEGILWAEIEKRLGPAGARESARRTIGDRAGATIFHAGKIDPLRALRTAEDLFALIGYRRWAEASEAPARSGAALERIRAATHRARFIEEALAARERIVPGGRAGKRIRFRVVARMAGEHEFRRLDLRRVVENALADRGDHAWRAAGDDSEADVELWATMLPGEFMLALRLSDDRMRHREYKSSHIPGSLRPAVAAAMAWLSEPRDDDVMLDPFCGAGTILIERAHLGRYARLLGGDSDPHALAAARENIGPRHQPLELREWNAAALPLARASVTTVVTNLPWGARHGSHEENRALYPRAIAEMRRVAAPGAKLVMLTAETRLMDATLRAEGLRPERIMRVSILGAPAAIYMVRNV